MPTVHSVLDLHSCQQRPQIRRRRAFTAAHFSHAPPEAGAELPGPAQEMLVTLLQVGRTRLSGDDARFMLFCENVRVNRKA